MSGAAAQCPLCAGPGGRLVVALPRWRVVHAQEPGLPAFYRVIWNAHVAEFSQLAPSDRSACMEAVVLVEQALLAHLAPAKVNLAAFGNMVPHLHWHVVARFAGDSRFPGTPWSAPLRESDPSHDRAIEQQLPALEADLIYRLRQLG